MPTKIGMVERIGESGLVLPELIIRGLAANDRLKYYLTLLQAAQAHARAPGRPASNLRVEREASGVADASLDAIVEASADRGRDRVYIPGACAIVTSLFEELQSMLQPLRVAGAARPELRARVDLYQRRLDDLMTHVPPCPDDQLTTNTISGLTDISENSHDTVHRLIMDLHGELSRLQTTLSFETVDGARVFNILDAERDLVRAFMKGVNQTAGLRFDHPGLATTAIHDADQLTIQNDLGLTPSHNVMIHVAGLSVTIMYTDVHAARVRFFHDLLQPYDVTWETTTAAGADYELSVGRYTGSTPQQLERYLTFVGSRLVFLIDWNRARKRLARFVSKADAVSLLKWAAENNIGHRAFLQAGDVRLIETALARAAPLGTGLATRLDESLGRDAARAFLMAVLRTTSSGLTARRSQGLIEDEVHAQLLKYLQTTDRHALAAALEHATMISALAGRGRRTLLEFGSGDGHGGAVRAAELARIWVARADQIARDGRRWLDRVTDGHQLGPLLIEADSAADVLEEAAFLLTLVPPSIDPEALELLGGLADLVDGAAREYVRCLAESQELSVASASSDIDDFFLTIEHLTDLGRHASAAQRAVTERLVRAQGSCQHLYVLTTLGHRFEQAVTILGRCGEIVRDNVLAVRLSR